MRTLCVAFLALNWLVFVTSLQIDVPHFNNVPHHKEVHYDAASHYYDNLNAVQSPIAISLRDTIVDDEMEPLNFRGYWTAEGNATLINTGHSAMVKLGDRTEQPYITGGPLQKGERYIFEQMHFHWARRDRYGSEHVIDGQSHSMEAHLVHYNEKYGNFATAITKTDGVAVLAFFIQAFGETKDEDFSQISDNIKKIREPASQCPISSDCLQWVASQELSRHYYTYHGSLTTPPYSECVTWIIYQAPVYVARSQVDAFRHIREPHHHREIGTNVRPIQRPKGHPTIIFVRNIEEEQSIP